MYYNIIKLYYGCQILEKINVSELSVAWLILIFLEIKVFSVFIINTLLLKKLISDRSTGSWF